MALKIAETTGIKANSLKASMSQTGDVLTFTVKASDLLNLAKPSKTEKSEGLMIALTGTFQAEIDGVPVNVDIRQGQGGMGSWTSLKASKR